MIKKTLLFNLTYLYLFKQTEGETKMAGLPDYSDNPIQSGNFGQNGDKSMEVALASKMQLILEQPMTDVATGLVNRDYEGDFFKIGDTVALIKPDISTLNIEFGTINTPADNGKPLVGGEGAGNLEATDRYRNKDARLRPTNIAFSKNLMTINKYAKYAFFISDFTEAEGKWNYESGNLDGVAHRMRRQHNRETIQAVINATDLATTLPLAPSEHIPTLPAELTSDGQNRNTAGNPVVVANGDDVYEKVIIPIFTSLYNAGAITADGQITYGSNAQEGKATYGCVYVSTKLYTMLLTSKYLQDRSTVAADEKVKTGKVKTVMGLDISIEPSLDPDADEAVNTGAATVHAVIAGTRNLVTRASKVLPPEKFRSHEFFADEYHGCEIYAEEVAQPKAGCVGFVSISQGE